MAAKRQKLTNDELYRRYSRDYNKIQNRLYRQTKRRMFSEKMTKEQFLTFYSARKNDMEEYLFPLHQEQRTLFQKDLFLFLTINSTEKMENIIMLNLKMKTEKDLLRLFRL